MHIYQMPRRTSYCQFFNTNTISSMTTYTKSKCKVMFAQCSGNSVISSCTICITLLESEDVPTVRSISISQILVLPDITDVKMLSVSQLLLCPCTSVPTLHHGFTHASHLFNRAYRTSHWLLSRIPRNRDHGIAPMIAESRQRSRPWCGTFSPRVVLNIFSWLPTLPHPAGGSHIVLGTSSTVKIRKNLLHCHTAFCLCVTTEQF